MSPGMQNAAFRASGYDGVYVVFPVPRQAFETAFRGAVSLGVSGFNVTAPFKEKAGELCDELGESASKAGAVNTVLIREGRTIGFNTDGSGFLASLGTLAFDPAGKSALIVGAGGAARGVAIALAGSGLAALTIVNRDPARAERLSEWVRQHFPSVNTRVEDWSSADLRGALARADLVVQATPSTDIPWSGFLRPNHAVFELITARTPFLEHARVLGCRCCDGREMLLYQGAQAFALWTGLPAPLSEMRESLAE